MTQLIYSNYDEYKLLKQQNVLRTLETLSDNIKFHWIGEKNRRKVTFQVDIFNNFGFYQPKTNNLVIIDDFNEAELEINNLILSIKNLLKNIENNLFEQIIITNFDNGLSIIWKCRRKLSLSNEIKLIEFSKKYNLNCSCQYNEIITPLLSLRKEQIYCDKFKLNVSNNIFLQPSKAGLNFIIDFLIK